LTNLLAPALLAVHVAVSLAGGALFGSLGVVGAAFIAPTLFAAVMLRTGAPEIAGHLGREVTRDALRFILAAGGCFGLGAALGTAVGSTLGGAMIAGLVGTVLYLGLLPFVAPTQVDVIPARPVLKLPAEPEVSCQSWLALSTKVGTAEVS
jgi:hypothetical protein